MRCSSNKSSKKLAWLYSTALLVFFTLVYFYFDEVSSSSGLTLYWPCLFCCWLHRAALSTGPACVVVGCTGLHSLLALHVLLLVAPGCTLYWPCLCCCWLHRAALSTGPACVVVGCSGSLSLHVSSL